MGKFSRLVIWLTALVLAGCQPVISGSNSGTERASTAAETHSPTSPILLSASSTAPVATKALSTPTKPLKPVAIMAFCTIVGRDALTYAPIGTPITLIWGWEAKTEAQLEDFKANNITTITLDGQTVEGKVNPEVKINQKSGQPEIAWFSEVGVLMEGEHTITYDVRWKKMIDDGATTYGPGGKVETLHDECSVIVR